MRTSPALAVIGAAIVTVAAVGEKGRALPSPVTRPAAEAPIDPDVLRLVQELGSDDYRTREKAGQQLAARGDKALPDLRRALAAANDPEVTRRLGVLVRKMDRDRLVAPKRVTAALKNKSAQEAFEEIARQTGYAIQFHAGTRPEKYDFEFADTPFWEAVDRVANAAGVSVQTGYDDDSIQIYNAGESVNPFVAYAGPFRFVAQNISSSRNVQLAGINRQVGLVRPPESMNLYFQVYSEPKNPILGVTQAELLAATDNTGASLVPPRVDDVRHHRSMYFNPGYRGHQAGGGVMLVRGDRAATAIRHLKGKVGIVMLAGTLPEVVVDEPEKVKNRKFVGRTVELDVDSVTEGNGRYTVSVTVRKIGGSDPNNEDYTWSNTLWQRLELLDAKGNKYRSYGPNSINHTGSSVQMTIQYGPDGRGGPRQPAAKLGPVVKLVFNEWVSVTHEVTFEFRNVPLP